MGRECCKKVRQMNNKMREIAERDSYYHNFFLLFATLIFQGALNDILRYKSYKTRKVQIQNTHRKFNKHSTNLNAESFSSFRERLGSILHGHSMMPLIGDQSGNMEIFLLTLELNLN